MVLECCFAVVLFQGGNNWVSGLSLSELGRGGGGGGGGQLYLLTDSLYEALVILINNNNNNNHRTERRNSRCFLQSPHCAANRLQHVPYAQVARAQSCANHAQHRALITCNMKCHVVRRDSSAIKLDRV